MKPGTLFMALVVAAACITGIVWLSSGQNPIELASPKKSANAEGLPISETGPHPKVVLPETMHDFDVMASGSEMSHTFVVKNEGEAPLKLKIKGTSCTCTLSDLAKDEIPVGEQGEVEVKWTPDAPDLEFSKYAELYTNDPENQIVTFTVKGRVEEILTINPQGGWTLENLERNKAETLTAEIHSAILDEFKITSIDRSSEVLEAKYEPLSDAELQQLQSKSGYRLTVVFEPKDLKVGKIDEHITVRTDMEKAKEISFPLNGQFLGSITALPYWPEGVKPTGMQWAREFLQINLGLLPTGQGGEGWYKVVVADMPEGVDFEVSEIESSLEFVTASVKPLPIPPNSPRQFFVVTFQVQPDAPPGAYLRNKSAQVILKTNHPYAPEIKFHVSFQMI